MSDTQLSLQQVLQAIADEPEFEGQLPQYLFHNWSQSPETMTTALRQIVRSVKQNIQERLTRTVGPLVDTEAAQANCICPECNVPGGVIARKDAFVNFDIPVTGKIDWNNREWVTTYDDVTYECLLCGAALDRDSIGARNGCEVR